MTSLELEIRNPSGLHARPAALFVRAAGAQRARIRVRNLTRDTPEVDARSLIAVLGLGVSRGHRIQISADGEDEAGGLAAVQAAVESGLGEAIDDHGSGDELGEAAAGGPTLGA